MYTYVQRRGCKKENMATCVHTGRVSNAYSRIHTWMGRNGEIASSSCSWGGNGMRRVHGEAMECVVFKGRGVAYRKTEETDLYGRNGGPIHQEACGIPQNGTPRDTVHLHRRPPPTFTGYRRPPPASTGSCSSSLHRALLHLLLFNHPCTVYCSSSPPHHRVLFNHPSTATPPPSTVHPALHTTGSCSSRGNATAHYSSTPPAMLTVHPIDRLQLAAVAKESLGRVQLTAMDRSLGFSNA